MDRDDERREEEARERLHRQELEWEHQAEEAAYQDAMEQEEIRIANIVSRAVRAVKLQTAKEMRDWARGLREINDLTFNEEVIVNELDDWANELAMLALYRGDDPTFDCFWIFNREKVGGEG